MEVWTFVCDNNITFFNKIIKSTSMFNLFKKHELKSQHAYQIGKNTLEQSP